MKRGFTKQDFTDKLQSNGDCLEWTGALVRGYGYSRVCGKYWYTHRLALHLEGVDVTGHHVLHSCDNPKCCNPAHLRLGTNQDNMIDKVSKGRQARGEKIHTAKLTQEQVLEIRAINGMYQKDIAAQYGVSKDAISKIIGRRTWAHI